MRWEDERYVRLYTRDTPDWLALGWEARLVFYELLRKVDRAGVIPWGRSRERGLAVLLHLPTEIVETGLAALVSDGCIMTSDTQVVIPNFLHAQECKKSDAERKREQRERDRIRALDSVRDVTIRDHESQNVTDESQNVTESHDSSHAVTDGHDVSLLTVPNRAEPNQLPMSEKSSDGGGVDKPALVFEAWLRARGSHKGKAPQLTPERRKLVARWLRSYDVETLSLACEGLFLSDHHRGNNDRGTKYLDFENALKDAKMIERFVALAEEKRAEDERLRPPRPSAVVPIGPPADFDVPEPATDDFLADDQAGAA